MRTGIVVPRYRHNAVKRNTLKRRLREIVRLWVLPLGIPMDLVIWAQRGAYDKTYEQLREEMIDLLRRLRPVEPPAT